MSVTELLQAVQFRRRQGWQKESCCAGYAVWEELITLLEDLEDEEEIEQLREAKEETITWEQAKAELGDAGVDV